MTFRCVECGHIFEDGEQAVWEERHGLDTPPYEKFSGCPLCRGEYEETKPCKHCGSEHTESELYEGWCEECLQENYMEYKYDISKCYALSIKNGEKDDVSIDFFLACMFSADEINDILYRELVAASEIKPIDCTPFIEADRSWFYECVVKGRR